MNYFALRLRELRKKRRLSQEELAKGLGITRGAVGLYEQGRREPDFETLESIADFFNVDIGTLITEPVHGSNTVSVLSPRECMLLSLFRKLNTNGQDKLIDSAEDLVASGRYIYQASGTHDH
jgi:transcriptional regulator with XRE-family HTH domain